MYATYDPNAYGVGPLQVGYQGYLTNSTNAFVEACPSIFIPIVKELNAGNSIGVKLGTASIDGSYKRSTSYTSYYAQAMKRANLKVLSLAPVSSIILNQKASSLRATGVIYTDETTFNVINVTATKEVILSAGVFHTPQLLMLSVCIAS